MMTRVILVLMLALGLLGSRARVRTSDDGGRQTDPYPHCLPCP